MNNAHAETVARRKLNAPDSFVFYRWECVGPDLMLTGCVSSGLVTKGKRIGRPRYDGPKQSCCVTDAEILLEHQRYEAETGCCGECMGTGQVFSGWNYLTGTRYRECDVCKGAKTRQKLAE